MKVTSNILLGHKKLGEMIMFWIVVILIHITEQHTELSYIPTS